MNGVNITEDTVTEQIMSTRSSMGYDDDDDWANYLASSGLTPESYREQVIDSLARQYLITQAISDHGITVTDEEYEEAWQEQVEAYGSEDSLLSMLEAMGYTKESYLQSMESTLAQQKLVDAVAPLEEPSDDEIISYMNENLSTYNDARRSSHILFKVASDADDATREEVRAKAQEVLDKINAGELTFEDAVKKYSEDASAENGGDVGWDKLTTFVTEYQDALSALSEGEMSGLVESQYGYHIILCTGYFHVDGEVTSIDQIPEDLRSQISDTIASTNQTEAYNAWLDEYIASADIQINPMPEDVPYNVSESSTSGTETGDGAASASDGSATSDGAATSASGSDSEAAAS